MTPARNIGCGTVDTIRDVWRITGLHHVAFAHDDGVVDRSLGDLLGVEPRVEDGPGFVERMFPVGDSFVQTLEGGDEGVVRTFLDRRGNALHHVAFAVQGIDEALEDLRSRGTRLVDERARPGGFGTRIAFVHPSSFGGLLVELVEVGGDAPAGPDTDTDTEEDRRAAG
jgi:methylmalonyl-CoA/ethylmalonyl-CoA epimerase